MSLYRATTSDNPLEMPGAVGYYGTLHEALRDAIGAAVSPVGGNDPWETVTVSRETGTDEPSTVVYTLTWTGTFSADITTTVLIEELPAAQSEQVLLAGCVVKR